MYFTFIIYIYVYTLTYIPKVYKFKVFKDFIYCFNVVRKKIAVGFLVYSLTFYFAFMFTKILFIRLELSFLQLKRCPAELNSLRARSRMRRHAGSAE